MKRFLKKSSDFLTSISNYSFLYIFFLYIITLYYFVQWPIVAGDTDLWYHLNSGRYFFEHNSVPPNSFFSFISPPREWIDYYWLFQAVVYKTFSFFDYYGLIIFKASIYFATTLLILGYLLKRVESDKLILYFIVIFVFYFLILIPRFLLVRPHTFSYLFITAFIYILEFKPKKTVYLPLLAVLWSNLHGIVYPVMLLIILSYIIEFFIDHLRERTHIKKEELSYIIPLVLSLVAVFLTPHGSKLISIPFVQTEYATQYIQELKPITLNDILSFQISTMSPSYFTIFNLILIIASLAVITAFFRRNIRASHLLLFAGGAFLLTKANRFTYEFALLAIPVIKANPLISATGTNKKVFKPIFLLYAAILVVMPLMLLKSSFSNQPRYPFSPKNLPQGIVTFLNHIEAGGDVLNHPDNGGYLQWMLYQKYRIYMDMEVPFLFTDEDFYTATNAFSNEEVLRGILSRYDPSFITVPVKKKEFKELIKNFPRYKLVFFDDVEVLYIDSKRYTDIAQRYELRIIDPFTLIGKKIEKIIEEREREQLYLKELQNIIEIYPYCGLANQVLARIYINKENYKQAIPYIDSVIKAFPDSPMGYKLRGDALKGLKAFDEAITYYKLALNRTAPLSKYEIYKQLGMIYKDQERFREAYKAFKKGIPIFSPDTSYKDLYYLGSSAFLIGKTSEAEMLYRYAYKKVPEDDKEWNEKLKKHLSALGIEVEGLKLK